jgi:hypothetical protein
MSSLATFFGWKTNFVESDELPDIFPLDIRRTDFVRIDVVNIYTKILTDCLERTNGLSEEQQSLMWDNCVQSESSDGLITKLAKAMTDKKELFIVEDAGVLREATYEEQEIIRQDYKKSNSSSVGIFISFKNYTRSDMVKLYSALEYCTVAALNKGLNLSSSIQLKMADMRKSVGVIDKEDVKQQALSIAKALSNGKNVLLDGEDEIVTALPDLSSVEQSISFIDSKRSFYLGLPESYINGEQTGGLGTTGENDTKAIERGLKNYYESILKPVLNALFGVKLSYKSQDFRQLDQALNALKSFELIGESYITNENKKKIIEGLLDIDPDDNETTFEEPQPVELPPGQTNFNQQPKKPEPKE